MGGQPVYIIMAQNYHIDDQGIDSEPKFYLPAGVTLPFDTHRFERLKAFLFDHFGGS